MHARPEYYTNYLVSNKLTQLILKADLLIVMVLAQKMPSVPEKGLKIGNTTYSMLRLKPFM